MVSTWIEAAAKGRHGGPVRAGMWSAVVVGTHPIESDQEVWLEVQSDDLPLGSFPAFWVENKGVNSLWHVPIPPQAVGARLHYRSSARREGSPTISSAYQDTVVRPNLPDLTETVEVVPIGPEGLVGNGMMTVRVDGRGSTYDVYFPTTGLHSGVRPAEGELPRSRAHFRAVTGGLAISRRLDWFTERQSWDAFQQYLGATNLLTTELAWRHGPVRVLVTDFVAGSGVIPKTAGGTESPGQYIKRFRVKNEGTEPLKSVFGVYIQAEVNGGIGEPGLSWMDGDRTLLASNRGHSHSNRKLARDATVEFALALDNRGEVVCEPTGPNEAILLRPLELPPGESVTIDLLVSGAFTGWRGDPGTFEHWLEPALSWFRAADLDQMEQATALEWDSYIEPLPSLHYSKPAYAVTLRRSSLALALHADARGGAVTSGYDRGLNAYCWPREAVRLGEVFDRLGHPEIGRKVYHWLARVRGQNRPYRYWFQKYTIDGWPEWETPAVDQSAIIPWGLESHYRRTGDLELVTASWPMIEQAAAVCSGASGHPGLTFIDELKLVSSAGIWDNRYAAFLYSNCAVVAGLRSAANLAELLDKPEQTGKWRVLASTIWEVGVLGESIEGKKSAAPGLVDADTGRFLDARRLSTLRNLWTDEEAFLIDRSPTLDISMLGLVVPFGLLPASDPRVVKTAEAIFRASLVAGDPSGLTCRPVQPTHSHQRGEGAAGQSLRQDVSSLATLWMARYLLALGRETGQASHWNRALAMLDGILGRLSPLGLFLRTAARTSDLTARLNSSTSSGAWGLHANLIATMLDFAGLDYDAVDRVLTLDPVLPGAWAQTGIAQTFLCGEISYRLERPIGGSVYHLSLTTKLDREVSLRVGITCPGLSVLGPWQSEPNLPLPEFQPRTGRLTWTATLPAGESHARWIWG